jgi:hypothetical protein
MGTIPSKTERTPIDGSEYMAGAAGGSDYKIGVNAIANYIISLFTNKTQLDKIDESAGGLPLYDDVPFGGLIEVAQLGSKSTDFTVTLDYAKIQTVTLNTATDYEITLTATAGVASVLRMTASAAVTFTWAAGIKWADGVALASLASGEEVRLHITCDFTNDISINWVKFATA